MNKFKSLVYILYIILYIIAYSTQTGMSHLKNEQY